MLKEKYINPFTDFGFKKIFGTELNKDLLIDFLNEVILPPHKRIKELTYRSSEHLGRTEADRKAIFDLYCISTEGERFIVEMQKAKQNYFKDRSVFYSTFPIQEQAEVGDWNYRLSPVYMAGILDFTFDDEEEKEVRHEVMLKNQKGKIFYKKLTFIYLEMPNFTKTAEELESNYDKWLYVLKHLPNLAERPDVLQEQVFQKLFEAAEIAKFNPTERQLYEDSLKTYRDLKNVIDTARYDAKIEGKIEGRMEQQIESIQKALKYGKLSIEEIAEYSSVTVEFVIAIKNKM